MIGQGFDVDRDVVIPQALAQTRYAGHLVEQALARPDPPPSFLRAIGLMACEFLELATLHLRRLA